MKKLIATVAFGTMLIGGIAAMQDAPNESAMEWEPTVFSVSNDVSHF
ncbi:hypothetical protein [Lentibacillus jeotgali]|nr:hypothetical protein [Lentibacillus jeotgali]